jgi:organic radical activating enzyme
MIVGLEITHKCNRMCDLCDHRIATSKYKYMTKEDYLMIADCLKNSRIHAIRLIGGEPLVHPDIHWFIARVKEDFPESDMIMTTNGDLLDKLSEKELLSFSEIAISLYPDNVETMKKFKIYPNVRLRNSSSMWDPDRNPDFDDKKAKKYHGICMVKEPRIIGRLMYGCCISEGIERTFDTGNVHKEISPNWLEDYKILPTYQACRHCFKALDMHQNFKLRMKSRLVSFLLKFYNLYKFLIGLNRS